MPDQEKKPLEIPQQSEEGRKAALARAQLGTTTATGYEATRLAKEASGEEEDDSPEGSEIPIAGGDSLKPLVQVQASEPTGAQAIPAAFTVNGSIPAGFVGTPYGPAPVSAVTNDPQEAQKRIEQSLKDYDKALSRPTSADPIPDEILERASGAELRAVAVDRGLDLGDVSGNRSTRTRFRQVQQAAGAESGGGAGAGASAVKQQERTESAGQSSEGGAGQPSW